MICDGEKNVAIAGLMGGENSEIYDDTKNVLIESAYFNPSSIRRTSKYTFCNHYPCTRNKLCPSRHLVR